MRNTSIFLVPLFVVSFLLTPVVMAVSYPGVTPVGEQTGGLFQMYFDNMYTAPCPPGEVLEGFTSSGVLQCIAPVASGLFVVGQGTGDTLRFDGTDWVRNNLIYNDGTNVGIGATIPGAKLDVGGTIKISGGVPGVGKVLTSDASGLASWETPTSATSWELTGNSGTVVGTNFLGTLDNISLMFRVNNTKAGYLGNTADSNTFFGLSAGSASNTDLSSVGIGKNSLFSNVVGLYNTAVGLGSLYTGLIGSYNTALGFNSLFLATNDFNTALGYNAGATLTTGINNIFLGANTAPNIAVTASDQLNIGNWIYGHSGSIGIGVLNPGAKLDVAGTIKITDGTQGSGKVLVSDNNGLASWGVVTASAVTASGITGGTEHYIPKFGSGGNGLIISQVYDDGTNIGVGTAMPGAKFDIAGTIKIQGGSPGAGKVLISDATGLASWGAASASSVYATGIIGGAGSGHYLTKFMENGNGITNALLYETGGRIGMNILNPGKDFDVNGEIRGTRLIAYGSGGINTNTAVGEDSLRSNTTGNNNTAIGDAALYSNTGGYSNTAVGSDALYSNTTGIRNVGIGEGALGNNTTGMNNTANGWIALGTNATGDGNSAFGYNALQWNEEGYNTAVGYVALQMNTLGGFNTAVGSSSLRYNDTGDENVALGAGALYSNTGGSSNTALGSWSLYDNTIGDENVAIGVSALSSNTSGGANTAVGMRALGANTTGYYNTANGLQALYQNTTGVGNTANGVFALMGNTTGSHNAAMGYQSLYNNTTGEYNVAVGENTLYGNTAAGWNTAIGSYALGSFNNGSSNTAVGGNALRSNTGGYRNSAVGTNSLYSNIDGYENTAFGVEALYSNTGGNGDVAVGYQALYSNTTGLHNNAFGHMAMYSNSTGGLNTAFGCEALYSNTSGWSNSAVGCESLWSNTTGWYNVAQGVSALNSNTTGGRNTSIGAQSLYENIDGEYNTSLGFNSLHENIDGSYNVAIGDNAGYNLTSGDNNIFIGSAVQPNIGNTASNQLNIGNWIYGNNGNIGVGVANPTSKFQVAGDSWFAGNVTITGSLIVDKIVNRTVNNVSVSGSLLPDAAAPLVYRDIGTNTGRWNNLYLSGQVTIGGGSPGVGKFLVSDANGLATWTGLVTATSLNISGAVLANTLYYNGTSWIPSNNIYNAGGNVGIGITGTAPVPTSKFEVWSGATTQHLLHFRGSSVGLGLNATRYLATGTANTGLGNNALRTLTTGYSNSAFGDSALYNNMQGYFNTAGGTQALNTNSNGNWNVALGSQSLYTNLGGSYNIALGGQTLYLNSAGNNNTAVGDNALRATTASNNTAFGYAAGSGITTGSNNIAIGYGVQMNSNTASNQLNIGNWIYGSGGNIGIGVINPLAKLDIGGTIKISGGSPGAGKILMSDASGLATWSSSISGATATGITGGVENYVPKFGTGGTGLYPSQIFDNGSRIGIGTGTNLTARLNIDSGSGGFSGLRFLNITSSSPVTSTNITGLGVNGSGEVVPISNGDVVVYDGDSQSPYPSPNPDVANRLIRYDFNKYFMIPAKQSFVVSDGNAPGINAPYIAENGSSSVCGWNGTNGVGAGACPAGDFPGSPYNSFTMSARSDSDYGYQIGIAYRGDIQLMARSGRFVDGNDAGSDVDFDDYGSGLYIGTTTPAPWYKVFTVPTNHMEWFYIDTGYTGQWNTTGKDGMIGIGTTDPNYGLDIRSTVGMMNRVYFTGANTTAAAPPISFAGDTNMGIFRPAADTFGVSTNGTERARIFSNGNVTIGNSATNSAKLRVEGQVMITGGAPGAGKVLTSDASGLATWETPTGGGGSAIVQTGAVYTSILSSPATRSATSLADLGLTTASLPVGVYNFKMTARYRSAGATTGIGFTLTSNGATVTNYIGQLQAQGTTSAIQVYSNGTLGSTALVSTATPAANTDYAAFLQGTFQVTATGSVKVQFRSETTTMVTVQPGSNLVVEQIQ